MVAVAVIVAVTNIVNIVVIDFDFEQFYFLKTPHSVGKSVESYSLFFSFLSKH